MTTALEIAFWLAGTLLAFPYLGYPLVLAGLARTVGRGPPAVAGDGAVLPAVTVIVSAHDEAAVIEEKIRTTLASDYPPERLGVMVVSDASTDGTNDIVRRLAAQNARVTLLAISEHRGKTAGLNLAMESVVTDLVVFTDANAIFERDAVRRLAECFADDRVGYAVGSAVYRSSEASEAGRDEGLYWRYELAIKRWESDFESVVGGDGAIYAIRRELYRPLAAEDINDFVNPLQIVAAGYRGVFRADAVALEDPANDYDKEFRRKRRIVCRSWGALLRHRASLNLGRHKRFAVMLVSHKVLRWFTVLWLAIATLANLALLIAGSGGVYWLTLAGIFALLALATAGLLRKRAGRELPAVLSIPYFFCLSGAAAMLGVIDYALGNRYVTWEHARIGLP